MVVGVRNLVFLNGASGSGKTTVASVLSEAHGYSWFHPDGAWDTPSMDQRVLTHDCIRFALSRFSGTVVIDSQLRQEYLDEYEADSLSLRQVFLDCDDDKRAARLSNREWTAKDIEAQIRWASFLREDAASNRVPIYNTSSTTIEEVTLRVVEMIQSFERRAI
jgi:gluconate kinase